QGLQSGETLSEVFSYEITDADGDTATATLTLTINGVSNTAVAQQVPGDDGKPAFYEHPDDDRIPLIVDHIVGETADAESSLNSIAPLLSDVNTGLAIGHPILTALNSLQDLGGTTVLSDTHGDVFSGIDANGPILKAVNDVGFKPLADQYDIFGQDFPDGAEDFEPIVTRSGFLISLAVNDGADTPSFHAQVWSPTGEAARINSLEFLSVDGEIIDGASAVMEAQDRQQIQANIELETGYILRISVCLDDEAGAAKTAKLEEVEMPTFSGQTERFAQYDDYETARLMQAIRGA
ncbi:hypothetical protein, partial [Rhodalgimonas zhirmunskyi]